jgi:hypothetical protein
MKNATVIDRRYIKECDGYLGGKALKCDGSFGYAQDRRRPPLH